MSKTATFRDRERELADAVLAGTTGEYEPAVLAGELAQRLRELGDADTTYGLELLERRALELINAAERARAPRHDGQQMLFDDEAILQLGDGRSVRLGQLEDVAQLDRAHAVRTRQHAGQMVSQAAWVTSYVEWRRAMIDTGLPLREAIARDEA
jgi:hypothetical protein